MRRRLCAAIVLLVSMATVGARAAPTEPAQVELGRHLFFDTRLSGDMGLSCASCHDPRHGWADGLPLARGYTGSGYFRNAPSLVNVGRRKRLMWDGRLDGADLATAVRDMVTEAHFMNADARLVQERVKQSPEYRALWVRAFGPGSEPYGPRLFEAIGAFLKTLQSHEAPVGRPLSGAARAGQALFNGKAGCVRCHSGPMLSDGELHRTGVPEHPLLWRDPLRSITLLRHYATQGMPNYMNARSDVGAYAISKREADRGRFATPSLRELRHTAPYMHNGMFATLDEVIDFYDRAGGPGSELEALHLTKLEKKQLRSYLDSLNGAPIVVAVPRQPEFRVLHEDGIAVLAPALSKPQIEPLSSPPLATLPPVPVPLDNPMSAQKVELGRMLFFDPRLSGDLSTPCSACHMPHLGWSDKQPKSRGYPGTWHWRNAQSVLNAAYFGKYNWDGAAATLERQAAGAAEGAVTGNGDPAMMEMRLRFVPEYVRRFREVFGLEWPRLHQAYQAIGAFQRTVVSDPRQVPFDRHLAGDPAALSEAARRGLALFNTKAGCLRCHHGALASDQGFHATGVPPTRPSGNTALLQITHRWQNYQRGVTQALYDSGSADLGLYYVTRRADDIGKFRTPSLRELRDSAPYMHNGAFASLREVVDFYDRGAGAAPNQPGWLRPLGLSEAEKQDLLAFLDALSMDQPLLIDAPALPPYAPLPAPASP